MQISLAEGTDRQAGNSNSDGAIAPVMDDTLVYVMYQSGIPCRRSGGPAGAPGAPTTAVQTYSCGVLNFVDANSGQVLYSVQSPGL